MATTAIRQQVRRIGPLGLIILLHIGFFYALQSGLLKQAVQALPTKEVFASFITPDQPPAPAPPKPQPAPPKTVPIVKKSIAPRPAPPVKMTPSPQAITAAPQTPSPPAEVAVPSVAEAPTAPSAPAAPAPPKTISSGVEYLQPPQPKYPPISRRMGEEGRVILRVLINDKGRPQQVDVQQSSGIPRLDEAGRQAVLGALFRPHIDNGQAVAVYAIVPIKFQLNN